jgi:hypothetical protein
LIIFENTIFFGYTATVGLVQQPFLEAGFLLGHGCHEFLNIFILFHFQIKKILYLKSPKTALDSKSTSFTDLILKANDKNRLKLLVWATCAKKRVAIIL